MKSKLQKKKERRMLMWWAICNPASMLGWCIIPPIIYEFGYPFLSALSAIPIVCLVLWALEKFLKEH